MRMCGKSSKFWNTMPMRERSFGRLVFGSCTGTPSTVISPFWKGSSALTTLISVDLPEPEGPQTTTTSPFSTFVVQSVSTWNCAVPLAHALDVDHRHATSSYRTMAYLAWMRFTSHEAPKQMTKNTKATKT